MRRGATAVGALGSVFLLGLLLCGACEPTGGSADDPGAVSPLAGGKADQVADYTALNLAAGKMVLYELQVRAANACDPTVGSAAQRRACEDKVAPAIPYRAEGMSCDELPRLQRIKLGTLDDLLEDTADYREGITLRYVAETVGANTLWLMPIFPNNDTWALPHPCDDLGSPYAVRDYFHPRGTLARACIEAGRDEYSEAPCWGDDAFDAVVAEAHARGLKVMLDVAFNHFGHNYLMYDVVAFDPIRERIARGEEIDDLWAFGRTEEDAHLYPVVLDDPAELARLAARDPDHGARLAALTKRCPQLSGQELLRAYHMWRVALDWERDAFPCDASFLEYGAPGFYLGANHWDPSSAPGDHFTNDWKDVKFLFHQSTNEAHRHELARGREYLFRILNYWVSRGVDGFRLDHTTDFFGGMGAEEWAYILSKVEHYSEKRGQARPVFLAEEFFSQQEMSWVVDVMTEGYVHDMNGRGGATKDAAYVEGILDNMGRFGGRVYVMTALETHDEHRLTDGTGFDAWIGAGFWGIGAATWSTPMILMGQEFGEPWGLGFRRHDLLRARFAGSGNEHPDADALVAFYEKTIAARLAHENRALFASGHAFLQARDSQQADPRILAMVKWSGDGNTVFVFHNLWRAPVRQSYFVPPDVARAILLRDDEPYRLVDVFSETPTGACRTGAELAWDLCVEMDAETRLQWLRLERCE